MSKENVDGARQGAPAARASEPAQPTVAAIVCLVGALAWSGAVLLVYQSHFTFLLDEWVFLVDRQGFSVKVFLDPYNDHIVLAPSRSTRRCWRPSG